MKRVYGAVIRQDEEDGGYWAEVPDLPGCFGQGDDFIDCVRSVSNGVETHIAAMIDMGMDIPKPTRVESDDGSVIYVYADSDTVDLGSPSISAAEAARRMGVTPSRVSQLISAGRLEGRRVGANMMVTLESIDRYAGAPRTAGRPRRELAEA